MEDYKEYLEHLVIEVEGKVGTMPACLRDPLKNEPIAAWISPINSPSPFIPTAIDEHDEGQCTEVKRQLDDLKTDINDNVSEREDDIEEEVSSDDGKLNWKDRLEKNITTLKDSMNELRNLDVGLTRQLLSVNDSIEELKWLNENYELCESKDALNVSSKSLPRYDSREQLHKRWRSERRLLASSRTNLNTLSLSNLSTSLSRLNQNNNSNRAACNEDYESMPCVLGPEMASPIVAPEEFEYHPRSMSTSCAEKTTEYLKHTPKPFLRSRLASTASLVRIDQGHATSTPKIDKAKDMKDVEASNEPTTPIGDDSLISRVRLGSYGRQVRWVYKQETEEEVYF